MDASKILPAARVAAYGSLAAFILSLAAIWTGLVPTAARLPLITATVVIFFGSVAGYVLVYGMGFGEPPASLEAMADSTEPGVTSLSAEAQYLIDSEASLGAGLGIWAGLISILVLGLLGSLISNSVGIAGTALGAGLTLVALALFLRYFARALRDREAMWLQLGRQRWQFTAYLVASFVLAVLAGVTRYLYHAKLVTGALIVIVFFLLIRLRLLLQDRW